MSLTRARYRLTPDTLGDGQWTDLRVDTAGALITTMAAGATTSPAKLEDDAHASGDMGIMALAVWNNAEANLSGTDLDYTPIAVERWGGVKIGKIIPGTSGNALGKAEDANHNSGDTGVFILGVRNDLLGTTLTNANGDYSPIATDDTGALFLSGAATGPIKREDGAHVSGDAGIMALGVANEAFATLSGTDLDYTPIAVTTKGAVQTTTGVARTTSADGISNSNILARVVDGAGNPAYLASLPLYFNGTTWDRMRGDTTGLKIKPNEDVFSVTLSTDTSAYADGDTFADTQLVSATFFEASGADRTLLNVVVLDKADQGFGIDLFFLDTNVALGTENAAPSITDTNAESIVGFVRISSGDWIDVGGARIAVINNISQVLRSTTQNLYIAAVVRGAGTYGASDVIVKLGVL